MLWVSYIMIGTGVAMDLANFVLAYRYGVLRRGASPIIGPPIVLYVIAAISLAGLGTGLGWWAAIGGVLLHLLSWVPATIYARQVHPLISDTSREHADQ